MILLLLSELNLLTVYLSFLLGLVNKFILIFEFGSFPSDLDHLIYVCYFHREWLLMIQST